MSIVVLRRVFTLAAVVSLASLAAVPARAQQQFTTSVPHAVLMDAATHTILFEKGADDPVVPASTTKIMTAEVVFHELKEGHIKLDDEFPVSLHAWRTGGAPSRGSTMFAALNSNIRVEDLIKGMVIDSGNDAAIVLAEGIAGSEFSFANRMNRRAKELGLPDLHFTNPWGQDDPQQRVTARDMALLAAHVIETYPDYYKYFSEKEFLWNKIKQPNRNPLLSMDVGADGLKTGYIDAKSGYSIVASAVDHDSGQRLILAIYGAKSPRERADEARKLLLWGFRTFEMRTLFKAGETVGTASVYGGTQGSVPLVAKGPVRVLVPRGTDERLSARIVYTGPLMAPIKPDQQVARLQVTRGNLQALDIPLETAAAVPVGPLPRRAMDASLELGIDLFRTYVLKK